MDTESIIAKLGTGAQLPCKSSPSMLHFSCGEVASPSICHSDDPML